LGLQADQLHPNLELAVRSTKLGWLTVVVALAAITSSAACAQQSLQELETEGQFQRALAAVDAVKHRKKMQCVLSAINAAVCQCLSENLPIDTALRSYPAVANREGEYAQLPTLTRTIVDRCIGGNR
jgi:hypothetical protein